MEFFPCVHVSSDSEVEERWKESFLLTVVHYILIIFDKNKVQLKLKLKQKSCTQRLSQRPPVQKHSVVWVFPEHPQFRLCVQMQSLNERQYYAFIIF